MDGEFSSIAYIEPSVIESWKSSMSQINSSCLQELSNFRNHASNLSGSWRGYAADAYAENFDSFLKIVEDKHEVMKNLDAFLEEVVITMENQ